MDALNSVGGYFTENRGQVNDEVRIYSIGNPSVAFRDDGVMFVLRESKAGVVPVGIASDRVTPLDRTASRRVTTRFASYMTSFENANKVVPVGLSRLPFNSSYFVGNDPLGWETDVPNYREVVYRDLYEGIDLVYRLGPSGLKYEFVLRPGADLGAIAVKLDGAVSVGITDSNVVARTAVGNVYDAAPYSYDMTGHEVKCSFAARSGMSYGFDCTGWTDTATLVIDPLVYSTFVGGTDDYLWCNAEQGDRGYSIAVDSSGSAYVYGGTCSTDFPVTPGAYNVTYWTRGVPPSFPIQPDCTPPCDCSPFERFCIDPHNTFVAKLNPSGSTLVYATYLGGMGQEIPTSISVDSGGNAYLTGATSSAGLQPGILPFPTTPGAYDTSFAVFSKRPGACWCCSLSFWEAFVTKLNPQGNGLVYSTFLGGTKYEWAWGIAVDSAGSAYVAGETNGTDFPTTVGAFDRTFNSNFGKWDYPDIFVTKLSPDGGSLAYSTFIGGSGYEWARSISVDPSGNAYITGETNSTNLPVTMGAFDGSFGGAIDGFVIKLDTAGSSLAYSSYLGGVGWELSPSIAADASGSAYVAGTTNSTDFPTTAGAYSRIFKGGRDAFITKVNPAGSSLTYSTFLGGNSRIDSGTGIALDDLGTAFVTGYTYSGDFPVTPDAFDTVFNDLEGFIARMSVDGSGLLYATFIGGRSDDERGTAIAVDRMGIAYVTGWTNSSDFPTTAGAFSRTLDNFTDAFVVKLNPVIPADPIDLAILPPDIVSIPSSPVTLGTSVTLRASVHNIGGTNASNVVIRFFDGPPPTNQIGADQLIGTVERFFGIAQASVQWTATPLGIHSIYVVVDPDDTIAEKREDNNQANAQIEVVPPMPDLTLSPMDIAFTPTPPLAPGTTVQIRATVHNVGDGNSAMASSRFYDGVPPSPQIGSDQPIVPLAAGASTQVTVSWTAAPSGNHNICLLADPDDLVVEKDETNNLACAQVKVLTPPDLVPTAISIAPPSPLTYGSTAWINVTLANWGEIPAGQFDVLFFDDSNGDSTPDAGEGFSTSPLAGLAGRTQVVVSSTWTALPEGDHSICVFTDPPPGTVNESNEKNNVKCAAVSVMPPPILTKPDYIPVNPEPPSPTKIGISLQLSLSIFVRNQGNDTAKANATLAFYDETPPAPPFLTAIVPPVGPGNDSSRFTATWTSPAIPGTYLVSVNVDYNRNITEWDETNNVFTWTIQVVSGPVTSLKVGNPNHTATATYVRSTTPLSLSFVDQGGSGIKHTKYRIENGTWQEYTSPFFLSGDGDRYVEYYSEDNAGNVEDVSWRVLRVDDSPPATAISIGGPRFTSAWIYVKSSTPLTLTAIEGGVGSNSTFYRLWDGSWTGWREYLSSFNLAGNVGAWHVEFLSFDYLGNVEDVRNETLVLDDSPPVTTISPASGPYHLDTPFTFLCSDPGSGVNVTRYRVDGGSWTTYSEGFTLPEGVHNVSYYSNDMLNNTEAERWLVVTVEGTTTPPEVAVNYKPLMAAIFAIVLLVAGFWSSRRRPWKGGRERMAVVKAFAITSFPFFLIEAATGTISFLTGSLSIPPCIGLGTTVDLAILLTGCASAILRVMKLEKLTAGETGTSESR